MVILSESRGSYILNERNVKDPDARLLLQACWLSQDMGRGVNQVLGSFKKFAPLY